MKITGGPKNESNHHFISFYRAFLIINIYPSNAQTPEQLYQKGLVKEEGEGDLQDALNLYKQVADNVKADQSLRAKALLRSGMCYEKIRNHRSYKNLPAPRGNCPRAENRGGSCQGETFQFKWKQ